MKLNSINPKNNKIIHSWDIHNDDEIELIISKSHSAFQKWKDTEITFRLECIKKISKLLRDRTKEFGTLMANEMGKPLKQGIAEVEKCAWLCDYYYENSEEQFSEFVEKTYQRFQELYNSQDKSLWDRIKKDVDFLLWNNM